MLTVDPGCHNVTSVTWLQVTKPGAAEAFPNIRERIDL